MKVWTPPEKGRSCYAARSIGGVLVAVFFCMAIICIVMLFGHTFRLACLVSFRGCVCCCHGTLHLAGGGCRQAFAADALMFLLDGKDRLFVLDVRLLAGPARNITGFVRAAVEIQRGAGTAEEHPCRNEKAAQCGSADCAGGTYCGKGVGPCPSVPCALCGRKRGKAYLSACARL